MKTNTSIPRIYTPEATEPIVPRSTGHATVSPELGEHTKSEPTESESALDRFYALSGVRNVWRRPLPVPDGGPSQGDFYVDTVASDRNCSARHIKEKVLSYHNIEYLTVTLQVPWFVRGCQKPVANWLAVGYWNKDRSDLAVGVICNLQPLLDFIASHGSTQKPGDVSERGKWIEQSPSGPFLRVPIPVLLHHRAAANVVVSYRFDDEAQALYQHKRNVLRPVYAGVWSDEPVCTYP